MCLKSICILGADVTNVKYAIHFVDHNLIVLFIPQKIITSPYLIVGVLEVVWTKFRLVWATELSLHRLRFHRMNLYLEGKFQRGARQALDSLIIWCFVFHFCFRDVSYSVNIQNRGYSRPIGEYRFRLWFISTDIECMMEDSTVDVRTWYASDTAIYAISGIARLPNMIPDGSYSVYLDLAVSDPS